MINRLVATIALLVTLLPLAKIIYAYSTVVTAPFANGDIESIQNLILPYVILSITLIVGYTAFMFKSNRVPKDKKMLWTIAIVVFHVPAMLFFWFCYIWKRPNISTVAHQT
ncbi:hypothetical protein GCM10009123_12520 [Kangiella japonica]|uniref:Uncharacterized protein n=1 Tax=Kangiella japonica TaxID=647384 RepID=A0ABN0SYH8_9GAMM